MLTNYARWYSFTPSQWPTLSPPLTLPVRKAESNATTCIPNCSWFVGLLLSLRKLGLVLSDQKLEPAVQVDGSIYDVDLRAVDGFFSTPIQIWSSCSYPL